MYPHQFCLFIQNNILFQLFLYIIKLKYALKKLHRKKIVNTSNYTSGLKHIHSTRLIDHLNLVKCGDYYRFPRDTNEFPVFKNLLLSFYNLTANKIIYNINPLYIIYSCDIISAFK